MRVVAKVRKSMNHDGFTASVRVGPIWTRLMGTADGTAAAVYPTAKAARTAVARRFRGHTLAFK